MITDLFFDLAKKQLPQVIPFSHKSIYDHCVADLPVKCYDCCLQFQPSSSRVFAALPVNGSFQKSFRWLAVGYLILLHLAEVVDYAIQDDYYGIA